MRFVELVSLVRRGPALGFGHDCVYPAQDFACDRSGEIAGIEPVMSGYADDVASDGRWPCVEGPGASLELEAFNKLMISTIAVGFAFWRHWAKVEGCLCDLGAIDT